MMNITTNNQPRELVALCDLPAKDQADFDYIREEGEGNTPRLVRYKGAWYDVWDSQEIRIEGPRNGRMGWAHWVEPSSPLAKWGFIISESYFSGVLFRQVDPEYVICGRYYS
jgi:hypothetical protein